MRAPEEVLEIRRLRRLGWGTRRIAAELGCSRTTGMARNPRTGEPVAIPRGRVVRFRPKPTLLRLTGTR